MTLATTFTASENSVGVSDIAALLNELSAVQSELLSFLREKRERMGSRNPEEISALHERELHLTQRLQACHDRRAELLTTAKQQGLPSDSLAALNGAMPAAQARELAGQIKDAGSRMRLLQHHSLTNWVVAQRALLHVTQLLEIIATGGRMQPTYGDVATANTRGGLLNSEA